ncbi:hypothetical protein CI109_103664 [Kwoniella shandongensis]|uniref:Uncharacterized protein n=1 Tax=Kwoniella shandongensis TaxID=1734106 RepID=A0A5M6C854_9TREE|nr:uncharacterized protein CI109_000643 [Kwoniella shandongensis]KAA5531071.1 hypothetical protein CI109_000643 [Kwoniella shandongensis]
MNRTFRLLKQGAFTPPIRPTPSTLPTNLLRPTSLSSARDQTPVGLVLARQLFGAQRGLATKPPGGPGPGEKGPSPGPNHGQRAEEQNKTPGAKEELKSVTKDFAKIIAGGDPQSAALGAREISAGTKHGSPTEDFWDVTRSFISAVPKPALYFGLAGTLPYLGTAISTVVLAREASLASMASNGIAPSGIDLTTALSYLHTVEHIQVSYGAIILSFLGAIHWGMEFSKLGGEFGYRRLALGIVPVLFAWPTTFLTHGTALAVQWFGFTGQWFLDQRASQAGWTTNWYSTYRFYLSIIVGFSIIGTLAGTSFYGAGAGAITDAKSPHLQHTTERTSPLRRLDRVKEKNEPGKSGKLSGKVGGDIAVEEEQSGEGFLKLRNKQREKEQKEEEEKKAQEEADKKKEEEKAKKAEKQDEKEGKQKDKSPDGMKDGTDKERKKGESNEDKGKKDAQEQDKGKKGGDKQDGGEEKKQDEGKKQEDAKKQDESKKEDAKKQDAKKDEGKKDDKSSSEKQKKGQEEKGEAGAKNTGMR